MFSADIDTGPCPSPGPSGRSVIRPTVGNDAEPLRPLTELLVHQADITDASGLTFFVVAQGLEPNSLRAWIGKTTDEAPVVLVARLGDSRQCSLGGPVLRHRQRGRDKIACDRPPETDAIVYGAIIFSAPDR